MEMANRAVKEVRNLTSVTHGTCIALFSQYKSGILLFLARTVTLSSPEICKEKEVEMN